MLVIIIAVLFLFDRTDLKEFSALQGVEVSLGKLLL